MPLTVEQRASIIDASLAYLGTLAAFRRRNFKGRLFPNHIGGQIARNDLDQLGDAELRRLDTFIQLGHARYVGWPQPGLRLFASHVAIARERFGPLREALAQYGVNLFFAHDDIGGGRAWRQSLLEALSSADGLVTIHSIGFAASAFCNQEVGFALAREVPVVSLMDGEAPSGFISEIQGFPLRPGREGELAQQILELVKQRIPGRYGEACAQTLAHARNFAHADMLSDHIVDCPAPTGAMLDAIELAVRYNDQVYGSGNQVRLTEFCGRHGRQW